LVEKATENLSGLEIDTVAVMESDLKKGYSKQAPFDLIFFDGAVDDIPVEISEQLAENGRLVAVVKAAGGAGKGVLMTRRNGALNQRDVFNADIPYLPGFEPAAAFEF
jgi:protein-L-isoaspartate(D-aspartate) O-methyltransferase